MKLDDICFLCKEPKDVTLEHVFPKWLQKKFNLWDKTIVLLNGSKIQYRNVVIPCCSKCNGIYLSKIEDKVRNWVINGSEIDDDTLFLWLSKIQFGLHYKEMFLKNNIADRNSKMIIEPDKIFNRKSQNLFLFKILNMVSFGNFKPYSMTIVNLVDSPEDRYFYVDSTDHYFTSIIMGKIGIVISMEDDGYIKKHLDIYNSIVDHRQCSTDFFILYSSLKFIFIEYLKSLPNYIVKPDENHYVVEIQALNNVDNFKEFDFVEFSNKYLYVLQNLFSSIMNESKGDLEFSFEKVKENNNIKLNYLSRREDL